MSEFNFPSVPFPAEFPLPRAVAKRKIDYDFGTNKEGIGLSLHVEQGDIAVLEERGNDVVDISHEGTTLSMTKAQFDDRYTRLPKQNSGQYISYFDYLSLEPGDKFAVYQIKEDVLLPMDFELDVNLARMAKEMYHKKYKASNYGITWVAVIQDQ